MILTASLLFYYYRYVKSPVVGDKLNHQKRITFMINLLEPDDKYILSAWVNLYPVEKKAFIVFFHPLTSFQKKGITLLKSESKGVSMINEAMSVISGSGSHFQITLKSSELEKIIDYTNGIDIVYTAKEIRYMGKKKLIERLSGDDISKLIQLPSEGDFTSYDTILKIQESVILTLFDNFGSEEKFQKKDFLKFLYSNLKTNISFEDFLNFYDFFSNQKISLHIKEFPSEQIIDKEESIVLIDINSAKTAYRYIEKEIKNEFSQESENAQIEILNGTKVDGLAKKIKSLLMEQNFSHIITDNSWIKNVSESVIIDRSGSIEYSKKVAKAMNKTKIYHHIDKDINKDVTVILGEDITKNENGSFKNQ